MCVSIVELDQRVTDIRSLKALKEETENAIKALEIDVIGFLTANDITEYIGTDYKATYKPQTRTTLDRAKLVDDLGSLDEYEKVSTFNVLRIK